MSNQVSCLTAAFFIFRSAFAAWALGNVLLSTFIKYGGLSRILTGVLLLGANVSFASVNAYCCSLEVRLGYREQAVLRPAYGWSFWLCLVLGEKVILHALGKLRALHWPRLYMFAY